MSNSHEHKDIDKQIEQLMECKPLSEQEVKELCDKVSSVCGVCLSYS
jgi:serine/threonine-protein phosphatase 2A catalytic subunit